MNKYALLLYMYQNLPFLTCSIYLPGDVLFMNANGVKEYKS